jgi:hypothetical protein
VPCNPISPSDVILPPVSDGFGGAVVPQLPSFEVPFPNLPIEDLLGLFNTLNMILPPGILRPNLSSNFSKDVMDAILSLLEKFMPFLMMYTFFMPILNMILCIIEVLCAINNPFKLVKAIIRLFRVCIPEFLALFPFFALILMIISLLLLILAIILYLIERIIAMIEQVVANIKLLAEAVSSLDNDSVIAITIKLGDLLCVFQNVFVLLGVIIIIFQIIERLLKMSFKIPPCDDSDGSDDGCCTPDVCPSFIKNNKQIQSKTGTMQYYNKVVRTDATLGAITMRDSSYQIYDVSAPESLQFNNITHAYDLPSGTTRVFFPEGDTYTKNSTPNSVPYTIDIRFFYDPAVYGRTDGKGARFIRITNCIVLKAPTDGVSDYQNNLISPFNGTLSIAGGTAYEDDATTIMKVLPTDFAAGTLETVVALADVVSVSPILSPTDGIKFDQLSYTFTTNHYVLIQKSLITLGCHPDVALNKNFINSTIGGLLNANADALSNITLPDVEGAQNCVIDAINTFRQSVSVESAAVLQDTVVGCLNNLKDGTTKALEGVINAGFDPFKSDFTLDPSIQFTTKPIDVNVVLNESSGTNIANNLPADVGTNLAANLVADITLGNVSSFTYDGVSQFTAKLTSAQPGNGTIKVSYNSQFISTLNNPTDTTQTPSVATKELLYTFVESQAISVGTSGGDPGAVRRDEGDVAREDGGQ